MSDAAELLLDLKDIHEPVAPATSSALLLGLFSLMVILAMLGLIAYFIWRRNTLNRILQQELAQIGEQKHEHALHQLAVLLRRTMHYLHGDSINQLQNEQWLALLDKTFTTNYFSEGRGSVFGETLYQPHQRNTQPASSADTKQLCRDLHKLIGRIRLGSGK